ncbi:hypothetical protein BC832DRAFT_90137 [Gaertneriomyces semiglobifer]|nr:hypothetical protein BC832DRAFT_90137 [Gaertneriomyces semiglobifer]
MDSNRAFKGRMLHCTTPRAVPAAHTKRSFTVGCANIVFLAMHRGPDGKHQPTCYECTGKPVFEFYCHPCKKLKHRDEFSKAQRNKKYHRCLQCVARYNQPCLDQVVDSDFEDEDMEGETSQISSHYLERQFEGLNVEDAREVYMSWTDDESSMYSTDYDD